MAQSSEETGPQKVRKNRKQPMVLVSIPGWPNQDPGRRMLYSVRPTPQKAARMVKRLKKQMPEYDWWVEQLSAREATAIKQAPFVVRGSGLAMPMEVKFTGRSWKVVTVPSPHDGRPPDAASTTPGAAAPA